MAPRGHTIVRHVDGAQAQSSADVLVPRTATRAPGHRFYKKLNELLDGPDLDQVAERLCEPFLERFQDPLSISTPAFDSVWLSS